MGQMRHDGTTNLIAQSLMTMENICSCMPMEWAVAICGCMTVFLYVYTYLDNHLFKSIQATA